MKYYLKTGWIITILLYLVTYFVVVFINWELYNPFQLFIDIPFKDNDYRGMLLACIVCYYIILFVSLKIYKEENEVN